MSNTLLNISGKIDLGTVSLYDSVRSVANDLNIPFVVVGASARDIVLHYAHGAPIQRATEDVDFGIQVPDWAAFEALKENLIKNGFKETRAEHRVISPDDIKIDIVPFGQVQDDDANIAWPPKGDCVMNVRGFQEACDNAEMVRIQDEPAIDIPVATPKGMAILKLIAWTDRTADLRKKDAKDLRYLFATYETIPSIQDELYANQELMSVYDHDIELAGAYQLGIDAQTIAEEQTSNVITKLLNGEHERLSIELLIEEMCENIEREYARVEALTTAFIEGFLQ